VAASGSVPGTVTGARSSARCRAVITAPASAASTTIITPGSSTTRMDVAQLADRPLSVSEPKAANVTTPAPSQAARPAGFGSHQLNSGTPAFTGTRAPAGNFHNAYPAAATMPAMNTPPITTAATNDPSLQSAPVAR
jgi:hypothetical protein